MFTRVANLHPGARTQKSFPIKRLWNLQELMYIVLEHPFVAPGRMDYDDGLRDLKELKYTDDPFFVRMFYVTNVLRWRNNASDSFNDQLSAHVCFSTSSTVRCWEELTIVMGENFIEQDGTAIWSFCLKLTFR